MKRGRQMMRGEGGGSRREGMERGQREGRSGKEERTEGMEGTREREVRTAGRMGRKVGRGKDAESERRREW